MPVPLNFGLKGILPTSIAYIFIPYPELTLKEQVKSDKELNKLAKFETYIMNNTDKIIDYRKRQQEGLVFTSNLAESTVESLINRRCKGNQHMQWSRDGLERACCIKPLAAFKIPKIRLLF